MGKHPFIKRMNERKGLANKKQDKPQDKSGGEELK